MDKRKIWKIVCFHFRQWRKNARVTAVFFLALLLSLYLSGTTEEFSGSYGTTVQIMEPFLWAFGNGDAIMLSTVLLILLLADLPLLNAAVPYYLVRTSRKEWVVGEIIYILVASGLYCLMLLIATGLFCIHIAFIGNVWSKTAALLGYSGVGSRVALPASVKAMEMSTPYACAGEVFILVLLYALFNATWMQIFRIRFGQAAGIVSVLLLNLFGMLFEPQIILEIFKISGLEAYQVNLIAGWISPLNHATYYMHNFGYDYLPTLWASKLLFLLAITGNAVVIYRLMKKYNFTFGQTRS